MGESSRVRVSRLSEEVIDLCILPRLPGKALLRFQCACRRWRSLISSGKDPCFLRLHCETAPSGPLYHIARRGYAGGCIFFPADDLRPVFIPNWRSRIFMLHMVASCNGLVCMLGLDMSHSARGRQLYVGNPCLRDWSLLPWPPSHPIGEILECSPWGLAVDVGSSPGSIVTYKLVLVSEYPLDGDEVEFYMFQVFSSTTSRWETSESRVVFRSPYMWPSPNKGSACVRGVMYWECNLGYVMWFDTKSELGGLHPLPQTAQGRRAGWFGEWNGELSFSARTYDNKIVIWSMQASAAAASPAPAQGGPCWIKRHSIDLSSIPGSLSLRSPAIKGVLRTVRTPFVGGGVVVFGIEKELLGYDMETGEVRKLTATGVLGDRCCLTYKSCLVPSPKIIRN